MLRKNKVGGIIDRRFGEYDPNMTAEEKMLERFAREKQKLFKKSSMFDLEDEGLPEDEPSVFSRGIQDDFNENDLEQNDGYSSDDLTSKRKRSHELLSKYNVEDGEEDEIEEPKRKKTKAEVMKEIIAKSKLHKYERQAQKEENQDLLAELDAALVHRSNPAAMAREHGSYDADGITKAFRISAMKIKTNPIGKASIAKVVKTEEQLAAEAVEKAKREEDRRIRRMRGEQVSDSSESEEEEEADEEPSADMPFWLQKDEQKPDFDLGWGNRTKPTATELGLDDEDDFVIDEDLVADSDMESIIYEDDDGRSSNRDSDKGGENTDDDSSEDVNENNGDFGTDLQKYNNISTLVCPQTHEEFLAVTKNIPLSSLNVAIAKIRAQYHSQLAENNKHLLAQFARVLIQHIAYLGDTQTSKGREVFTVIEALTKHVHSMAKTYPISVAAEFRAQLGDSEDNEGGKKGRIGMGHRPLALTPGDMLVLVAAGSIFPSSDHFHQVATPAMLVVARFLGQKVPQTLADYAVGTFLATLAYQYQSFAKRHVPEALNFCLNTLCALAPTPFVPAADVRKHTAKLSFPLHSSSADIRLRNAVKLCPRKMRLSDVIASSGTEKTREDEQTILKLSILSTTISLVRSFSYLWSSHVAYPETFAPILLILEQFIPKTLRQHLPADMLASITSLASTISDTLSAALTSRRPLLLHDHRKLPIRVQIPRFEEGYDPDKHYDPDRARAERKKLDREYKREKKGALRELRKDAHFLAREKLRAKVVRDEQYERKFKRLVAEIQGEEGHEKNEYERERKRIRREKDRAKAKK